MVLSITRIFAFSILLVGCVTVPALSQGPREDYQRSERLKNLY